MSEQVYPSLITHHSLLLYGPLPVDDLDHDEGSLRETVVVLRGHVEDAADAREVLGVLDLVPDLRLVRSGLLNCLSYQRQRVPGVPAEGVGVLVVLRLEV